MNMTLNFAPLVQALIGVGSVAVSAGGSLFAVWVQRRMRLDANSAAAAEVDRAVSTAGGIVYASLAITATGMTSGVSRGAAIQAGVQHVIDTAPAAVDALGLSSADLWSRVAGSLGDRLAVDPTVTLSPGVAPVALRPVPAS